MKPTPTLVPILSAGRHRRPKQGACFMEFASYLAGERWSDHPSCTHPLLASLARGVNDLTSDSKRTGLLSLVHRVVGLTTDDPALANGLVVRAACAAIPVASMERQRALAAGLLSRLPSVESDELRAMAFAALQSSPDAERWARQFLAHDSRAIRQPGRGADEAMVNMSVAGIALACYGPDEPDADARLVSLLTEAIAAAESFIARPLAREASADLHENTVASSAGYA